MDLDAGIPVFGVDEQKGDEFAAVKEQLGRILSKAAALETPKDDLVRQLTGCFVDNCLPVIGQISFSPDGTRWCRATVRLPNGRNETIIAERH